MGIDDLHDRIAEAAQREFENSVTTDGGIDHGEYLGERIANAIMPLLHQTGQTLECSASLTGRCMTGEEGGTWCKSACIRKAAGDSAPSPSADTCAHGVAMTDGCLKCGRTVHRRGTRVRCNCEFFADGAEPGELCDCGHGYEDHAAGGQSCHATVDSGSKPGGGS